MTTQRKKKLLDFYDRFIPEYARFPLTVLFFLNLGGYELVKLFTSGRYHYDMTLPIDLEVPILPATVLIYFGSYLVWIFGYVASGRIGKEELRRFFAADVVSKIVSYALFIIIPTARVRPEITGTGFFDALLRMLYAMDTPEGLFPSLHCLNSWMCFIGVRKYKKVRASVKVFYFVAALAVFIATLTTGQHVIVDVFAGIAVGELGWFLSRFAPVLKLSQKCMDGLAKIKARFFSLFKKKSPKEETVEQPPQADPPGGGTP